MDKTIRTLKALSDATRLRIVLALTEKACCVCELASALDLPQTTVSRCLRILRDADIVVAVRSGRWTDYRLNESNYLASAVISSAAKTLQDTSPYTEDKKRIRNVDRNEVC